MTRGRSAKALLLSSVVLLLVLPALACSGGTVEPVGQPQSAPSRSEERPGGVTSLGGDSNKGGVVGSMGSAAAPQVPAPSRPAQGASQAVPPAGQPAASLDAVATLGKQAAVSAPVQQRIIVRTVDMTLVVDSVSGAVERVSSLAVEMNGWVVSSKRTEKHRGSISIRVPAERLEEALQRLRASAVEVKAESSTGQDVTDEYVDIQSRIKNFQATADQLLKIIQRPGEMKDVLEVQRELTRVQGEIERLQGRIRFLEETATYSLINIVLELAPATIAVDAGPDQVVTERESISFRATFTPPEGITEFVYQWDFGDGTPVFQNTRTAPTADGKARTTATVTHAYGNVEDSPFIVTFSITGTGEAGIAKGEDTVAVTLTKVPNIQVEAGPSETVYAGETVKLEGSFTRPEGITELTYRWEFGDGRQPATGPVPEGATTIATEHVYTLASAQPYRATFTIRGKTSFGAEVEASDTLQVTVLAPTPWVAAIVDFGETTRLAVRSLAAAGQALLIVGIWLAVFSPLWVPVLIGVIILNKRANGGLPRRLGRRAPPAPPAEGTGIQEPS